MSRKPEQRLWDAVRRAAPADVLLERVENITSEGRPDVDALWQGIFTPIELKVTLELPPPDSPYCVFGGKGLSVEQRNWHLRWAQHGGRSLIFARAGGWALAWDGRQADNFNDASLERLLLRALWSSHDGRFDVIIKRTICDKTWRK